MKISLLKPFVSNGKADEFDVRQMKKALNRLGYYHPYDATGITGTADRAVFDALRSFQSSHGLSATGTAKPDDETITALNAAIENAPDGEYIWRTVGDDRVRGAHAALNGTKRKWSDDPDPQQEFGCRCWADDVDACAGAQEAYDMALRRRDDILARRDAAFERGSIAVETVRKSTLDSQKAFAEAGMSTLILQVPLKVYNTILRLVKIAVKAKTKDIQQEVEREFDKLSESHRMLQMKAEHAAQEYELLNVEYMRADREVQDADLTLRLCKKRK